MSTISASPSYQAATTKSHRMQWLDALRGLLIIIMAIDHASFFILKIHRGEFWGRPLPSYEAAAPFLTRVITHICAPGFFFLMGISMLLFAHSRYQMGWSEKRVLRHFLWRGALLILLQFILENPTWLLGDIFTPVEYGSAPGGGDNLWFHFGVLYALGLATIVWSFLLRANTTLTLLISGAALLATQLLIPEAAQVDTLYSPILRLLLIPGQTNTMQVYYPLLPWMGLTGAGIAFGRTLLQNKRLASQIAGITGSVFVLLSIILRSFGGFGNFHAPDGSGWINFLNLTKYPPSLTFLLLTLGLLLLLITLFMKITPRLKPGNPLLVFGKVALFVYITHLYLFALVGFLFPTGTYLWLMYLLWLGGLALLYPLSKAYRKFKQRTALDSFWRML